MSGRLTTRRLTGIDGWRSLSIDSDYEPPSLLLTFMKIEVVMDVQSPATYIRDVNVKTFNVGRLRLPHGFDARVVLVTDGDFRLNDAIHFLFVNISLIPSEGVHQIGVGFVRFRMEGPFHFHSEK